MRTVKFTLKGATAFFKKPDVNTYIYFTYGQIHKIALLGILGSILGLKGYGEQKEADYPEFYEKLQELKIAIVPRQQEEGQIGMFGKKIQAFNNSVGYASQEAGGNLIVKEQWLENPIWDIYIKEGHAYYEELKRRLLQSSYVYIPYLGKNDHLATILDAKEIDLKESCKEEKVTSLFLKDQFMMQEEEEDDLEDDYESPYKYEEKLPIALEKTQNQYKVKSFILTNQMVTPLEGEKLYSDNKEVVYFF